MNGEFVEIEDNFVPDYASDPYRRKHIRIRFNVKEGQTVDQTKDAVEQYIANYIHENKVESPHIVEKYIPEPTVLPSIQKDDMMIHSGLSLEEEMNACTEIDGPNGLKSFKHIAGKTQSDWIIYNQVLRNLELKMNH